MKRKISYLASLLALLATTLIINFSRHDDLSSNGYTVRHVIDGDTIELSDGEKVRYIGIDTPEVRERTDSGWVYKPRPFGEEAKEFNRKLVEGKRVRLELDVQKKDKYKRILAYVYTGEMFVNIEMVRQGFAMIYTYPPNLKYLELFLEAQKEARDNKRGLWAGLEENKISTSDAKNNIDRVRMIEAIVTDTYLTEKMLILKFKNNFTVVIYKNNIPLRSKDIIRSPNKHFKGKMVRVYGLIKEYKGHPEIVIHDISQIEILQNPI
ncbi:MAG: thermonuclease family protein [Candidatus Omnitrophota bacterium]|nr:thermonuclease family protein [Candidatus Omnitrophota bacterium]